MTGSQRITNRLDLETTLRFCPIMSKNFLGLEKGNYRI
jgi:hypothetical protein